MRGLWRQLPCTHGLARQRSPTVAWNDDHPDNSLQNLEPGREGHKQTHCIADRVAGSDGAAARLWQVAGDDSCDACAWKHCTASGGYVTASTGDTIDHE